MNESFSDRVRDAKAAVSAVTATDAAALRDGCEPPVFLDPRSPDAIAESTGIIPGARNVTLADIEGGRLPPELASKGVRVITACQAGPMGAVAAHALLRSGFTRVSYLEGGTQAWLDAGLPTTR